MTHERNPRWTGRGRWSTKAWWTGRDRHRRRCGSAETTAERRPDAGRALPSSAVFALVRWRASLIPMVAIHEAGLHDDGIIHRDGARNVLVGDDGRTRVGDFGLARRGIAVIDEDHPPIGNGVAQKTHLVERLAEHPPLGAHSARRDARDARVRVARALSRQDGGRERSTTLMAVLAADAVDVGRSESSPSRPGPVPDHLLRSAGGRGPRIRHGLVRDGATGVATPTPPSNARPAQRAGTHLKSRWNHWLIRRHIRYTSPVSCGTSPRLLEHSSPAEGRSARGSRSIEHAPGDTRRSVQRHRLTPGGARSNADVSQERRRAHEDVPGRVLGLRGSGGGRVHGRPANPLRERGRR